MNLEFIWDDDKAQSNLKKHGVSFDEATTIFTGFPLEIFFDPESPDEEDRYLAIGVSSEERILLVVHCENRSGTKIRIISARKATQKEAKQVFGGDR